MKYIAYGSNMSLEQMKYRCPNARLIGTGYLPKYRLEFYLHATVEPDPRMRKGVPVAVFEIDSTDEESLDRYEGFPRYYRKENCTVNMRDGSKIEGIDHDAPVIDLLIHLIEQLLLCGDREPAQLVPDFTFSVHIADAVVLETRPALRVVLREVAGAIAVGLGGLAWQGEESDEVAAFLQLFQLDVQDFTDRIQRQRQGQHGGLNGGALPVFRL